MHNLLAAVLFVVMTFGSGDVRAQLQPAVYIPCKLHFQAGSHWSEVSQDYAKHNKRVMPMSDVKRCDMIFLRSTDSARVRISFCHEKPRSSATMRIDSVFSRKLGASQAMFTRVRMNGRDLYDVEIRSKGCSHPWGTLIRADELPAMDDFLRDLSMEDLHD